MLPLRVQSRPWSDGNEGVLRFPQSSSITGTSPSDCLVSDIRHSLDGSYLSAEMQSVYSTAPAEWVTGHSLMGWVLLLCQDSVSVFYSPSRLGNKILWTHFTFSNSKQIFCKTMTFQDLFNDLYSMKTFLYQKYIILRRGNVFSSENSKHFPRYVNWRTLKEKWQK